MKNFVSLVSSAALLSLVSCGNQTGNSSQSTTRNLLQVDAGQYEATLIPLNAHLAGDSAGRAVVKVQGDEFQVEVSISGSRAQTSHPQRIHIMDSCPTLSSDINKDGVIDAVEGTSSYGPALIPLDGDLSVQVDKEVKYPVSDFSGNYFYRQQTSMKEMMNDLISKDGDLNDNLVKLTSRLNLAGRQVVIYGTDQQTAIPETVATINGEDKHSSLPIACGTLIKVAVPEDGSDTDGGKD